MTNDFAVVDQQQTRKSPMWPAVGAIGGGVAGYVIGNRRSNAKTHEDLVKEAKDITDFSTKPEGEKELWETLNTKLKEKTRLEDELKKASEAKLPENTDVAKRLAEVEKEAENALKEMRERANRTSTGIGNFPNAASIKTELNKENYPNGWGEINRANCSQSKSAQEILTEYVSKLQTAENNLKSKLESEKNLLNALKDNLNSTTTGNEGLYTTFYNKLKDKGSDDIAEYFRNSKKGDGYKEISKYFDKNFGELTNDNIESVFKEWLKKDKNFEKFELLDTEPSSPRKYEKIEVMGNNDFLKTKWVSKSEYETALEDFGNELKKTRTESIEKMLEPAQRYVEEQKRLTNLFNHIASEKGGIKGGVFVDAGIIPNTDKRPTADNIRSFVNEASSVTKFTDTKGNVIEGYAADVKRLELAKNGAKNDAKMVDLLNSLMSQKKAGITEDIITKMNTLYGDNVTIADALKKAKAKESVYGKYIKEEKSIKNNLEKIIDENPLVKEQMDKIAEIENTSKEGKALKSIRRKLADTFPGIFGKYNVDGVVTETTAEVTENDLSQSLKYKLKKVRDEYAEAAKKDGKVDEEAKKKAEEALEKGKKDVEEAVNKLKEKLGKGGTKGRIIGAILGVAAGAGLLWLIAPKKSKEA